MPTPRGRRPREDAATTASGAPGWWPRSRRGLRASAAPPVVRALLALEDAELLAALAAGAKGAPIRAGHRAFAPAEARERVRAAGLDAVCRCDPAYPAALRDLEAPPAVLHATSLPEARRRDRGARRRRRGRAPRLDLRPRGGAGARARPRRRRRAGRERPRAGRRRRGPSGRAGRRWDHRGRARGRRGCALPARATRGSTAGSSAPAAWCPSCHPARGRSPGAFRRATASSPRWPR